MKKTVYTFLILSITVLNIYAQQGWFWLNPLPQGNYLSGITFTENNTGYLIGSNGTLLKSTNNGISYYLVESNLTENFQSFYFVNQTTGFIGTDNGIIYKTYNGGNSIEGIFLGYADPVYNIKFINTYTGYALTRSEQKKSRIYRTLNTGNNWDLCYVFPDSVCIFNISCINNTIYASGENIQRKSKFYKSTDNGNNWFVMNVNILGSIQGLHFINEQTGFASQFAYGRKFFRTTSGGVSWDTLSDISPDNIQFINTNTGFAYGQYSNNNIYKTTNMGINWYPIYQFSGYISKVKFLDSQTWISVRMNSISYTSNSGANWNEISSGFNEYLDDVFFVNSNTGFIAAINGKVYKTTNSGYNWIGYTVNNTINYGINCLDFLNENTGFAGTIWSTIAKSTNGGINWNVMYIDSLMGESIIGISIPSADTGYAVGKYDSFLKTTNGGINWLITRFPNTLYLNDVYFINNTTGYCAGRDGGGIIKKTTNGGLNWQTFNFDSVFYFTDLHFVNSEFGFAVGNKLYNIGFIVRTTNGGITWDPSYLPGTFVVSSVYFLNENVGYAGAEGISYKTTNGGNNWFGIRTKSPDLHGIYFINENTGYAVGSNGTIIKTTNGGGDPIGIEYVGNTVPNDYSLFQNYPNPFNPVTKIKFSVPHNGFDRDIKFTIYDITGRAVKNYQYSNLNPGTYSIEFDGTNFASGVYFYRVESGNFRQTRKMVLIK
ncbi:MAG: Cytochrome c554 [Chlorobi bacterium OLB5]|nr:MAG: Cytochrome c554 [Chlorobi bacterium OLB5]